MRVTALLICFCLAAASILVLDVASAAIVAGEHDTPSSPTFIDALIARLNPEGKPIYVSPGNPGTTDGCAAAPPFPIGKQTVITVPTKDGERSFILYIPTSYQRLHAPVASAMRYTPAALQVMFHGLNDNCQNFLDATGFVDRAEQSGYLVASACGSRGILGTGWNAGMCCGFFGESPDDVGLARTIVDVITQQACVDSSKVMAMGLSNGAMLAEVLGCKSPDVFRAVASVSGIVEIRDGGEDGLRKCSAAITEAAVNTPVRRPSVLMIHGDADALVPWGGSKLLGFPDMPSNIAGWVERNGCPPDAINTINTTVFVNAIYEGCAIASSAAREGGWDSMVEVVRVIGGGHNWPRDEEFSTTDYIYEFGRRVFGSY